MAHSGFGRGRREKSGSKCWSRLWGVKEGCSLCLSDCLLSIQTSSQMSRGSGAPRGVLHAFSQSPKLQNASSAAALGSRPGKHAERPVSKGSAAAWKKTPINTGRFSEVSFLFFPFISCNLSNSCSSVGKDAFSWLCSQSGC